jgi:tRNA threonylcarbamoyladenosine modification (KEOPS) complex Cgi121 subunit
MRCKLYASAKRQIQKAIDIIGVNPESETVAAVIVGATPEQVEDALQELTVHLGVKPDDSVLKLSVQKEKKIRGAFKIGDREIETVKETTVEAALVDLVIEHVALLSTQQ